MKKTLLLFLFTPFFAKSQIITTASTNISGVPDSMVYAPTGMCFDTGRNLIIIEQEQEVIVKKSPSGVITPFAGTRTVMGSSGDGGPATAAHLYNPSAVAADAHGNIYVADAFNYEVRKIDPSGIITCFAGTPGTGGYSGDGGPATAATMAAPYGIAIDASGNVYVADQDNSVVRKIDASGIIHTIAGNTRGYSGDGGPATAANLNTPTGLAFDAAGNLYIADNSNFVIRKIDPSGTITTFAGSNVNGYTGDGGPATSARFSNGLSAIICDADGNVYFNDVINNVIRKVNTSGIISTYAGTGVSGYSGDGGLAKYAQISYPSGLAMDKAGNLFEADMNNNVVRKISGIAATLNICTGDSVAISDPMSGGTWHTSGSTIASLTSPGYVKGIGAGLVTLIYVADGDTAYAPLTVAAAPTAGTISATDSTCYGGGGDLLTPSISGGYFNWHGNTISNIFPATTAGIDTVQYTVAFSCGSATASRIITVVQPKAGSITGPDSVCVGSTVTLSTSGDADGTWWLFDSTYGAMVGPGIVEGLGTVMGIVVVYTVNGGLAGCDVSAYYDVFAKECSTEGISAVTATGKMEVYPNPANSEINIVSPVVINELSIYDCTGREALEMKPGKANVIISLNSLPAGMYMARINNTQNIKFIKE